MKIQERSFCTRSKNDTGEPTAVFSVALTEGLWPQWPWGMVRTLAPLGPAADDTTQWINGVSIFLDEHPKGTSSLFILKKKKRGKGMWSLGCSRAAGFIKLSFKALKVISFSSSHNIESRLFLLNETHGGEVWPWKRNWNPVLAVTAEKTSSLVLSFGFWETCGTMKSTLNLDWANCNFSFLFLPSSFSEYFVAKEWKSQIAYSRPFLVFYSNPTVLLISFYHFIPNCTHYYDSWFVLSELPS